MDITKIKQLVKQGGDKFILVENGEAELVVMSFKEYERISRGTGAARKPDIGESAQQTKEYADDFSFDNLAETEFVTPITQDTPKFLVRLEDIRLEDLPV